MEAEHEQNAGSVTSVRVEGDVSFRFTPREMGLLKLAMWRLMNDAYANHGQTAQKRPNENDSEATARAEAFYKDAVDAEALLGKLRKES